MFNGFVKNIFLGNYKNIFLRMKKRVNKMRMSKKLDKNSTLIPPEKLGLKWGQFRTSGKDGMLLHYVLFGGSMAQ